MKTPEEIKKALEHCTSRSDNPCDGCPYDSVECANMGMETDALAYIKQLEEDRKERDILADAYQELEANQPKWISVEERLPNDHDKMLVSYLGYVNIAFYRWDHTFELPNGVLIDAHKGNITHWMPLPQALQEVI